MAPDLTRLMNENCCYAARRASTISTQSIPTSYSHTPASLFYFCELALLIFFLHPNSIHYKQDEVHSGMGDHSPVSHGRCSVHRPRSNLSSHSLTSKSQAQCCDHGQSTSRGFVHRTRAEFETLSDRSLASDRHQSKGHDQKGPNKKTTVKKTTAKKTTKGKTTVVKPKKPTKAAKPAKNHIGMVIDKTMGLLARSRPSPMVMHRHPIIPFNSWPIQALHRSPLAS